MQDNAEMTTISAMQENLSADLPADSLPQDESPNREAPVSGNNETSADPPFLEIRYNKQLKGLTKEQAAVYAQKGMKYEQKYEQYDKMFDTYKDTYTNLERIADLSGVSVEDFLNGYEAKLDRDYENKLAERFGEDKDTINELMRLYSIDKQQKLDSAAENRAAAKEQEEKSLSQRLASEFEQMKSDFPELEDFISLPAEVKRAAFGGMPLPYAYLMFKHTEHLKAEQAQKAQQQAAEKTTGSMSAADTDNYTDKERRYLKALWGRYGL